MSVYKYLYFISRNLTCGFACFGWANNSQFDGKGRVGLWLTEIFDWVEDEGIACLPGGKEVDKLM